jgi:hypothetical protein
MLQVIYAEPEHHGGWGRSMKGEINDPQDLVYRAHRPSGANHNLSRNQGYQPLHSSQWCHTAPIRDRDHGEEEKNVKYEKFQRIL